MAAQENTVEYWKGMAEKYKLSVDTVQEEFDEFQTNSRDLEKELETQLEQLEKKSKELSVNNELLVRERDTLRSRLENSQGDTLKQLTRLEEELTRTGAHRDELQRRVRELEQCNDDLERSKRNISAMVEELEKRTNEMLERNAILESEIDEKQTLHESIQRLKEETRDLRQEITVRDRVTTGEGGGGATRNNADSSCAMEVDAQTQHNAASPAAGKASHLPRSITIDGYSGRAVAMVQPSRIPQPSSSPGGGGTGGTGTGGVNNLLPTTPSSSRVSALNIVGDLLRKVGALETRLASCRKYAASDANGGPMPKQPHLSNSPRP